ncbi:DUF6746 family protein [Chromatocurvus halotolerans]|uniref:Secreted protein n=1 Tax=Chromatocurvus halotolerans TaxID=1132028 RepID=A0A4R2KDU4_9GAMM|nr:DUF6746 family protein [Chromatocurvus halotolerans]TCO71771.1 hypothetical protein EV688_12122 [Chromatocurvus halotolerans]
MRLKHLSLLLCLAISPAISLADDRPDHYSGEKAESLEEALENLRTYSDKLSTLVEDESFDSEHLNAVHELTYTLENALETVEGELQQLAETLESVHVASEQGETTTVAEDSRIFLEKTRVLLQQMPR